MSINATLELRVSQWGTIPIREIWINGKSVPDWLARRARWKGRLSGLISPVGWASLENKATHERLFPDGPADFPDGRRAVLVCRECGGLGCGAVSVSIEDRGATILWRNWLWQNDYDETQNDDFEGRMPDFEFERGQYFEALRSAFS